MTTKIETIMKEIENKIDNSNKDTYLDNDDYYNGYRAGLLVAKNICKEISPQPTEQQGADVEEEEEFDHFGCDHASGICFE